MKLDLSGTSAEAGQQLFSEAQNIQQSHSRRLFPANNLSVDPTRRKPLGKRTMALTCAKDSRCFSIHGENSEIFAQLEDMSAQTLEDMQNVGIIFLSYVLHDFPSDLHEQLLTNIRETCPAAALIIADYTMRELTDQQAMELFTANLEHENMLAKTIPVYLEEHRRFTYDDICVLLGNYFPNVQGLALKAARGMFIGSEIDLIDEPALRHWADESPVSEQPMLKNAEATSCPLSIG